MLSQFWHDLRSYGGKLVGQIVTRSALNPTSLLPSTLQPTPMHRALPPPPPPPPPPPRTNLHVQVPSHTPSTSPTPCTQPYRHYLYCTAGGEKVQIWGARLVGIRGKTATFWRQIGGQHVPEKCARATYFQRWACLCLCIFTSSGAGPLPWRCLCTARCILWCEFGEQTTYNGVWELKNGVCDMQNGVWEQGRTN